MRSHLFSPRRAAVLAGLAGSFLALSTFAEEPAKAPAAPPKTIILATGEVLRGSVTAESDQTITLSHPVLGTISIPRAQIKTMIDTPGGAPATLPDPAPPVVPPPPPPPPPATFWQGWKGSVDAGVAGSAGNTETFASRVGLGLNRSAPDMDTAFSATYSYAADDGTKSRSRGELNGRNDWKFGESPWGIFALSRLEFDEFTNYKWRVSGFAGPSYTLFKPDPVLFRLRAGIGGAYEWAGPSPNETFVPEAMAGFDFTWKISERQAAFATFDYLPSLDRPPAYRLDMKAGWQITVDPETNLVLKVGVADRYNSNPGTRKRNDVEYFMTLGFTF